MQPFFIAVASDATRIQGVGVFLLFGSSSFGCIEHIELLFILETGIRL